MNKIINPCVCKVGGRNANAFAKIKYKDGRLSITGVVGPLKSGNCRGSSGQCVDEIRDGTPAKNWNRTMLSKFCDIWERWHLNDFRPGCCEHQRELGWPDMAKEFVTLYHYVLSGKAFKIKEAAEEAAKAALRKGETFTPTAEQTFYANLAYCLDVYEALDGNELAQYYEPRKPDFGCFTEEKYRVHIFAEESELGLLCKPCPVCGYKYGSGRMLEKVPQDVLDWLFALPDTERKPAWV